MKITHVITTLDSGGAENALLDLTQGLQKKQCQQNIIYLKGLGNLKATFENQGVPVQKISFESFTDKLKTVGKLKKQLAEAELVHSHLLKANSLTALCRGSFIHIGTRHNDEKILNNSLVKNLHKKLSQQETHHIAISQAVKKFYVKQGLPAEKFSVIPYGYQKSPEDPQPFDLQDLLGIPHNVPRLLHAGRLVPQKGQRFLLEALTQWPEAHLIICGEGPLKESLQQLSERLKVSSRIHWLGFRHDLPRWLVSCDLFVLPSLWEGFGRVLLEAMAWGCPLVASDCSAIPEVVGDTVWLCPPGDSTTLAITLKKAWDLREKWPQCKIEMRQRLEENFSLEKMIEAHHHLYHKLLHDR